MQKRDFLIKKLSNLELWSLSELHAGPNFATRLATRKRRDPTRPAKIHEFLDSTRHVALQTLRPIVSSPDRCGFNTNSSLFLRKRLSLVQTFRWHETLRSTIEYTDNVYLSCLPCSRQLSRYSSHAANGKLASFSASSCWCGVIWIWRYQRHSTACDDTDDGRLLAFYDQFIKDYHCSQVPAHWCFYERTGEREVGYKRLMIAAAAARTTTRQ